MLTTLTTSLIHTQPISRDSPQELIPCALRFSAPQRDERVPTHFVILLDTSDSMNENNKLENVKQCIRLLMNILGSGDYISLITFASDSNVVLNRVPADSTHRSMIEHSVSQIRTDGMTNLSAGLSRVFTLLRDGQQMKTGLLLLTDGHANMGFYTTPDLRVAMDALLETYPLLSLSCVAYGTNHNSELLQTFTRNSNGSYCIVNSLEDTAVAIGDTLGGLMSCAAQNVEILWPRGTEVQGMYQCSTVENHTILRYGDIYSGADKIILAKIPAADLGHEFPVEIRGMQIPAFRTFHQFVGPSVFLNDMNPDIILTRLQNDCTSLFRSIRQWAELTANQRTDVESRIEDFARGLDMEFLAGHPVHGMLREELNSIRNALLTVRQRRGGPDQEMVSMLSQHEAYVGLGRGATTSIQAPRRQRIRRQVAVGLSNEPGTGAGTWDPNVSHMDPEEDEPTTPPVAAQPQMTSPYQTDTQRRVTQVLRSMSTQP